MVDGSRSDVGGSTVKMECFTKEVKQLIMREEQDVQG